MFFFLLSMTIKKKMKNVSAIHSLLFFLKIQHNPEFQKKKRGDIFVFNSPTFVKWRDKKEKVREKSRQTSEEEGKVGIAEEGFESISASEWMNEWNYEKTKREKEKERGSYVGTLLVYCWKGNCFFLLPPPLSSTTSLHLNLSLFLSLSFFFLFSSKVAINNNNQC